MSCCCGRYFYFQEDPPLIVNGVLHEAPGEGKFCGPVVTHDLRDAEEQITELRAELARVTAERDELLAMRDTVEVTT